MMYDQHNFACKKCGEKFPWIIEHQLSNSDRGYCPTCYRAAAGKPEPADRPIQDGDWVECGEKPTGAIVPHARVKVDRVCFGKSGEPLLGIADSWHYAIMFKRVDGPHPEAMAPASPQRCQECHQEPPHHKMDCSQRYKTSSSVPVGTGNARPLADESRAKYRCRECHAQARVGLVVGLCAYCAHSLANDLLTREQNDRRVMLSQRSADNDSGATDRAAAWSRAEKPRVTNRAQRKQMAAGHPKGWPSNEGEE